MPMKPMKERRPLRVVVTPRYTCWRCGVETVHLMQLVQHGIVAHGLNPGHDGFVEAKPKLREVPRGE